MSNTYSTKASLLLSGLLSLSVLGSGCSKSPDPSTTSTPQASTVGSTPAAPATPTAKPAPTGITVSITPLAVKTAPQTLQEFLEEIQRGGDAHRFQRFYNKPDYPVVAKFVEGIFKKEGTRAIQSISETKVDDKTSKVSAQVAFGDGSVGNIDVVFVNVGPRWAVETAVLQGGDVSPSPAEAPTIVEESNPPANNVAPAPSQPGSQQ